MATMSAEGNGIVGYAAVTTKPPEQPDQLLCGPPHMNGAPEESAEAQPEVDIVINNVVCSFNVRCHLNLRKIALSGCNVEFKRENARVIMKTRNPYSTATIWSSGKITCTGSTSEEEAKKAARRVARILQKLGFGIRFCNYRVVNVLGTCTMPFGIHIIQFSQENRPHASYEPELYPGVTYRIKDLKATLKIFSTGSITVTAPSIQSVQSAIEYIFPLVYEFRKERSPADTAEEQSIRPYIFGTKQARRKQQRKARRGRDEDDVDYYSDEDEDEDCWE